MIDLKKPKKSRAYFPQDRIIIKKAYDIKTDKKISLIHAPYRAVPEGQRKDIQARVTQTETKIQKHSQEFIA